MKTRYAAAPEHVARMNTAELRDSFLAADLFTPGGIGATYLHHDRIAALGVVPLHEPLELPVFDQLRAEYFLQRREAGVINVGGPGAVVADGERHELGFTAAIYLGRGTREVVFSSEDPEHPAAFYVFSAASHASLPTTPVRAEDVNVVELGTDEGANRRTLNQYIYDGGVRSSQIAFGYTRIHSGSAWNTMPPHTHDRRTECYLYFDLAPEDRVFHVMGQPQETRHLVVADRELVVSPSWSVHFGAGTGPYAFVWATAGENDTYDDMDHVAVPSIT